MKYSTLIEDMIVEGATPEMILVAVRAVERQEVDALERRRAADRARQERHRSTPSRDKTLHNVSHAPSRSHAGVEDRTSNLEIEPKEESKKQNAAVRDVVEFKAKLSPHLDADLLDAFVKVRKTKRATMTGYAAGLFIADAAKCNMSVPEAATECVRSSWTTVKPEYFQNRKREGPTAKVNHAVASVDALMEKLDAITPSETQGNPAYPYLVAYAGNG